MDDALAGWQRVEPVELPVWVVGSGTVWLRDGSACRAVKVADAARGKLRVEACAMGTLACEVDLEVAEGLLVTGERCRAGGPRGDELARPVMVSHPDPLALVHADGEVAAWKHGVGLAVLVPTRLREQQPCTATSRKAIERTARDEAGKDGAAAWLAARGIVDGVRTCDRTEGFVVEPVMIGTAGSMGGIGTRGLPDPADCTAPCPENPVLDAIARAEVAVAGARFAAVAEPAVAIHRTKAACEAAPAGPEIVPPDLCERVGKDLLDAVR